MAILFIRSSLFMLLISLVACGSAEERKASYISKAEAFLENGNFPKARVALRNVVKIDPKDTHAYFLLARVAEKEQEWLKAFKNYLRVVDIEPTHRAALTRLARFYLASQEKQKVSDIARTLLKENPNDYLGETLIASVLYLDGDKTTSLGKAKKIAGQHPQDPDTLILLAAVFSAHDDFQTAQSLLESGLAAQPNDIDLLNNVVRTYLGMEKQEEAERVLRKIIDIEPNVFVHREKLAQLYVSLEKLDQAQSIIRQAIEIEPDNEKYWERLVVYSEPNRKETVLLEAVDSLPHSMSLRFLLGQYYEYAKDTDKARKVYEAIAAQEDTTDPGLKAEVQLARMDLSDENRELANTRLERVLQESPRQPDALLLKGQIALKDREGKEAVQAFRTVLKDNPGQSSVQSLLGKGHLLSGELELAHESFEKAVDLNPRQFDAWLALARLSANDKKFEKAQQYLSSILQVVPTQLEALGLLFKVHVAQKQWSNAEKVLTALRSAGGSDYAVDLADGLLAQSRQQWDRATDAFQRAQKERPDELAPLAAIVKQELHRKRPKRAQKYLQQMVKERPDHPYASGLLGAVSLDAKEYNSAALAYKAQTEINPSWVGPWVDWARLKRDEGQRKEAVEILKNGIAKNPDSFLLMVSLASLYQEDDQIDSAIAQYEQILQKHPNVLAAVNNLAYLLSDKKGDRRSLERALTLAKDFENKASNPLLLDTLAWVHFKLGNNKEALGLLRKAVAKAPKHPLLNYHYGAAAFKAGDNPTAREYIEKAVESGSKFEGLEEARQLLVKLTTPS